VLVAVGIGVRVDVEVGTGVRDTVGVIVTVGEMGGVAPQA
jgi:hypothetical protein